MITRRDLLQRAAIAAAAAACLPCAAAAQPAAMPKRAPNIVYVLADDLGAGDLGCYGQRHFPTPRLDAMAGEGLRFTQHYTGSPVCLPSRVCLMTGMHTGHAHVRGNGRLPLRPDPQDITLPRLLKNAGYATALCGKSGLASNDDGGFPNAKGFDHFFGFTSHTAAHRHYPTSLWRDGKRVALPENTGETGESFASELFVRDALDWLGAHADGPLFLHLALTLPHADLAVPAKYREPFDGKFDETPIDPGRYRAEPKPKSTYAGMISFVDEAVGRVLDRVRELGIAENTLVLFASDNGAMSEGGYQREWLDSSGPLRGGKRDLYEGGIRTPHLAWWPGTITPGGTSDHVSAFWDVVPTACELAGVAPPPKTDGISYAPTLLGNAAAQRQHDLLYWEFHERGRAQAIRREDWKAVRKPVTENGDGPIELYHLKDDAAEANDVAAAHPQRVAEFDKLMRENRTPHPEFRFVRRQDRAE